MSTPYAARRVGANGIASAVAAVLGLVIAGCGGGATLRAPHGVHLNGQATGNYVSEVSASGTTFLLPAADVANQGSHLSTPQTRSLPAALS